MLAFLEQMVFWPMVRHKDPAAPATTLPLLSVRQWACLNFGITLVCITCSLTRHLKGIESWGIALVCTTHWLTQHLQDVENKTVDRLQQGIRPKAEDYCNSHKNGVEGVHGQTQNRNLFKRTACIFKAWVKAMVDYGEFMIYQYDWWFLFMLLIMMIKNMLHYATLIYTQSYFTWPYVAVFCQIHPKSSKY